ncbi:thiazolinyl imide reductase [Niveispirillum sp. SYP-B3756]|uniref:Gfo/Idh/MocA family oxidoreductase n=1 Tax=Niveispirillum sp. SYP-B3756 TaxID=2662178 RepID=UPI0012914CD6|nr:Gfo/Idh/MocA family oxidoreductase [Niveispirillum sp. SYP-B3756]MQP65059.1 thiazolinyl imide reductase [Niveispirillum sp. SYP-B3756]
MGRTRVLVAGTAFGRIYLEALRAAPDRYELAGILAKGSAYSRDYAARLGVPFYNDPAQVPDEVDIACIVLRSGATGGDGAAVAQHFLRRGVHVLQEHPVHVTEITAGLQAARQGNAAYAVNTLYPNIQPVRQFLAVAAHLRGQGPIRFIDAACNSQVAYPLLDILGRAIGDLRPWSFQPQPAGEPAHPFTQITASLGGIPVSLQVQNQVHPEDPDNHSHLLHRIAIGFDGGVLTLADSHGPVLWTPRLHSPRDETGRLKLAGPGTERLSIPTSIALGGVPGHSHHRMFDLLWPEAVLAALHDLRGDIAEPARRRTAGQWALTVSQAWRALTGAIGMPALIRPPVPEPIPVASLEALALSVTPFRPLTAGEESR